MTKPNDNQESNYPSGFNNGVTIRNVPILNTHSGKVFWVTSNGGSDINAGTRTRPRATIAGALSLCKADRGDIIMCKSGHVETVSAAAGIAIATSGVSIIGLGQGADRPTLTFGTSTAASVTVTANNVTIQNIVGVTAINGLLNPFNVTGNDCYLDIEWQDPTTILEALRAVLATSVSRLSVKLKYKGQTGGSSNLNAIALVGVTGARINIDYVGILTTAVVQFKTTACKDVVVNGYMYVSGTTNGSLDVVDTVTGSTWYARIDDGAAGKTFAGGSAQAFASDDIFSVTAAQETGVVSANTGVMVTGATIFTVTGGPVMVLGLCSVCQTANNATASTLQYSTVATLGALAGTISGASATLASAVIGTVVTLIGTALSTAPVISATGVGLMTSTPIIVQPGTITLTVGVGSTTGTWKHYLRYQPLVAGASVS